jgi:hypothetical protein
MDWLNRKNTDYLCEGFWTGQNQDERDLLSESAARSALLSISLGSANWQSYLETPVICSLRHELIVSRTG